MRGVPVTNTTVRSARAASVGRLHNSDATVDDGMATRCSHEAQPSARRGAHRCKRPYAR